LSGVLLDTCAIIWLFSHRRLNEPGAAAILKAVEVGEVHVSPVSAWELGLLASPKRKRPLELAASPMVMFETMAGLPGTRIAALDYRSAIRAASLPDPLHDDPADRLLISVARDADLTLVTRDRKILDYAARGHVKAVRC
jgi:PIN domain nuclease of toxin-antitoxin system